MKTGRDLIHAIQRWGLEDYKIDEFRDDDTLIFEAESIPYKGGYSYYLDIFVPLYDVEGAYLVIWSNFRVKCFLKDIGNIKEFIDLIVCEIRTDIKELGYWRGEFYE